MIALSFLGLIYSAWLLSGVNSQEGVVEPAPLGNIDIQISIEGNDFSISFAPESVSSLVIAKRLCIEQASKIGVTEETLAECETKVGNYLQSEVDKWIAERLLKIPVVLNDNIFDVSFFPERDSVAATSNKLCLQYAEVLGLTKETFNTCVTPVANFLNNAAESWLQEKTLQVPVLIDEKEFEITFLPERQTPRQMALKVCSEYQKNYGLADDLASVCVSGITEYLDTRVSRWAKSKVFNIQVPLNIGTFTLQFIPERETTASAARRFCFEKSKELELTEENFYEKCGAPLNNYLKQEVQKWAAKKKVIVPLRVQGESVEIAIFPDRESSRTVAERFCVARAQSLNLTQETFRSECVVPVLGLINDAVREWEASNK